MAVWLNKCYFIKLRGTKAGQECASIGRKSRGTLKRAREVQEIPERQNWSSLEEQQGDRRCTAEVHERYNRGPTPN